MDNQKNLVVNLFNNKFKLEGFINFTQEIFKGKVKYGKNIEFSPKVKGEFNSVVKSFLNLGRYTDSNRKSMILAVVELNREDSIARSRTIQRNFVKDYFLKGGADSALVVFYNKDSEDWRLSFIKLDYSYKNSKLQEDITPAKRFSFLLGKNEKHHTAVERFMPLILQDKEAPTINELEEVFNIEVVTKEFFEKYCDLYLKIKNELDKQEGFSVVAEKADIKSDEFAKKLMGQLVFLYFLQKKGWLGVKANPEKISKEEADRLLDNKTYECNEVFDKVYYLNGDIYIRDDKNIIELSNEEINCLNSIFINTEYDGKWGSGDKSFIRSMFKEADNCGKSFFKDYLELIFYNALNDKRGGSTYFKELNCKIPFLNGGLFQPISENYDYKNAEFIIDNSLFSNNNKNKQGDIGDGILDIFDRYAFTVKEDEPLEKEVAVDPEMLGKVFENLLDITDRKKKGAFYTPREIVHYMCQESLINYLVSEVNLNYDEAEALIRYGDIINDIDSNINVLADGEFKMPHNIRYQAKKIDTALENVKIADPAVGSGAFPLGMVNEIVRARMNLTYYIMNDLDAVSRNTRKIKGRTPYDLKLKTIRRCIHAVDIERSAVDITKLRLWLSLVVEENDFRNIKALPNLDYNIMVGNSLIEEFEGVKLFNENALKVNNSNKEKEEILEQLSLQIPIKSNDNLLEIICELENKLKLTNNIIEARKIEYELEEAKKSFSEIAASCDVKRESEYILDEIYRLQEEFFEANGLETKVKLKNSIDSLEWLLIEKTVKENGNEELLPKIKEFKRTNTKPYFLWKLNFARVFREKGGFDIVIGNPPYGVKMESKEKRILKGKYSNVPDYEIAYYFIYRLMELINHKGYLSYIIPNTVLVNLYAKKMRIDLIEKYSLSGVDNLSQVDVFESAKVRNCILAIKKEGNDMAKFRNPDIKNGSYYVIEEKLVSKEILRDNLDNWLNIICKNDEVINIINDIKKGSILLGSFSEVSQGLIPYDKYRGHSEEIIKNKIWNANFKKDDTYKKELKGRDLSRYNLEWNGKSWISYGDWLAAPRKKEFFTEQRILIREITNPRILATITDEEYYNTPSIINIIRPKGVNFKYLLGLINSKLMTYYHINTSPKANKGLFPKILVNDVRNLPIRICDGEVYDELISLVEKRLAEKNVVKMNDIDSKIDRVVYQIYGLSTKEIDTIENSNIK